MKFVINDNKLKVEISNMINSGSFRDYLAQVEFDESWQNLSKEAIICKQNSDKGIARAVINNKVYIDMPKKERYTIGFIGYTVENNEKIHQKSTDLKIIPIIKGAGEIEATNVDEIPTKNEWEIYLSLVQEFIDAGNSIINQATNIDADLMGQILTITNKNGERKTINVKGDKGDKGDTPQKGIDYYTDTEKNEMEADITNKVSSLIPDVSNFITASVNNLVNYYLKSDTYSKTEVNALISATKTGIFKIVSTLPTPSINTLNSIYLIPSEEPKTSNIKDEYITIEANNAYVWEKIGSTAIDLSGYAKETWVNAQISDFLTDTEIQQLINTAVNAKYTKPATGIPKTDLAGAVQTSLGKADTSIQPSNFSYDSTTQTLTITV